MSRFEKCVWPLTATQTKVLVTLLLVIFGLLLFSHIVKSTDDGSQTTGQDATTDAVNFPSTGKLVVALLLLIAHKVQCPRAPEFKKREN